MVQNFFLTGLSRKQILYDLIRRFIPEGEQCMTVPVDRPAFFKLLLSFLVLRKTDRLGEHDLRILRPGFEDVPSQHISSGPQIAEKASAGKDQHILLADQPFQMFFFFFIPGQGNLLHLHIRCDIR